MKKFASSKKRRNGAVRFIGITAVLLTAAIFISALPNLTAHAESNNSFFGLAEYLGWSAPAPAANQRTAESLDAPEVIGTCDTAGPVEVEATAGTTAPTAYATLSAAFAAINAGTHQGVVTVEICGDTTETATATLNSGSIAPAAFTAVNVAPVGAARTVTGSIIGAIIRLNGADNVTIDGRIGGTGRNLTVTNSSTAAATAAIWLSSVAAGNGATNNIVRNLEIACGAPQNTGTNATIGILMGGTTISTSANGIDNDNNQFLFNRIIRSRFGIVTRGTTTDLNIAPIVTDNIVGPAAFGADEIGQTGIFMQADTGASVSRNLVQYVGGTFANTTGGADRAGIAIGTNSWSATDVATLTSNSYTVTRNIINNVIEERTFSAVGIKLGTTAGGSATNNLVANNFILNVRANGTAGDQLAGIGIGGGNGDRVVFNSISITGDVDPTGTTATTTYGNAIRIPGVNGTNNANFNIQNNSIYMDVNSNTATIPFYAITLNSTAYSFGTGALNYNNYFINQANAQMFTAGFSATSTSPTTALSFKTLANFVAGYPGQNANSIQADPQYVSITADLHIAPTSPNADAGVAIAGVTNDIDGENRVDTPDIGADEQDGVAAPANDIAATAIIAPATGATFATNLTVTPQASFTNLGTATQTNVQVTFTITGPGGYSYTDTQTIATIAPNQTVTVTFAAAPAFTTPGAYTTTATVTTPDANAGNDTTTGSFTVIAAVNGTVNVGTGEAYTSLTNTGGLFQAINAGGQTGNLVINITTDLTGETGTVALNEIAGGFSVTIKPSGAARTISGTSAGYMIPFNGTDNVTIDGSTSGGTDRSLTITNAGTGGGIGFTSGSSSAGASGNTVKNVNIFGGSPTATTIGIAFGGNAFGSAGTNINNRVENCDIRGSIYGIYSIGTSAAAPNTGVVLTRNVMTATGTARIGRIGIFTGNDDGVQITENGISGIVSAEGADAIGIAAGSQTLATTPPIPISQVNAFISRNNIGVVQQTNTFSAAGIVIASGATGTNTVVNNFVSGVIANADSTDIAAGIYVVPVAGATQNIYFNSVSMSGDRGTGANQFPSFALVVTADQPTNVLNNILVNTQTRTGSTGGGGESVAFGILPATFANINSNHNDLFVSGPNGVVGLTGGLSSTAQTTAAGTGVVRTTLADFQTATGKDANSVSGDPMFISTTDLHINASVPTVVSNAGTPITGITNDIDNDTRTATPDIGADEFTPIVAAGTLQFGSAASTANEGATATITVTRSSGSTGTVTAQVSVNAASTATGGASCTAGVDYINTGFPQTLTFVDGDISESFTVTLCPDAVLDDDETIIFDLINPTGGATVGTISQTTLTINDVPPPLTGTYTVPGSFASLTNPGGIFEAINTSGASGNITIEITDNLTNESGAVALNQIAGGFTVLIRPTGLPRTITSTTTAVALLRFAGTDNVTVDGSLTGGTDRSLTLSLANATINGTVVVFVGSNGAGAGANNFTIRNTTIEGGTNFSTSPTNFNFGIYAGATSGAANGPDNDNLTIQNNLIQRVNIGIQTIGDATGLNDNTLIADNTLGGAAAADFLGSDGIFVGQSTGASVTRNIVRNITNSAATDLFGITFATGVVNSSITRNSVSNMDATNTGGYGSTGININTTVAASNVTVANNFVFDIRGTSYNSGILGDVNAGIRIAGTNTGGINIYHNSVNLFGDYAGFNGATVTAAFLVNTTTATNLDVRNNIFVNSTNNTTVTTDKNYAFYSTAAAAAFSNINFNDYYVPASTATGPQVLGFIGSDRLTLAALRTGTGGDLDSLSADPLFVSPTDLHIQTTALSPVANAGTPLAAVTNDFDDEPRSGTRPDIGADEFARNAQSGDAIGAGTYSDLMPVNGQTLGGNVTVLDTLTLGGNLNAGNNTFTFDCNATVIGAGGANFIEGNVAKNYCAPGSFTYPVGTTDGDDDGYSPVTANISVVGTVPSTLAVDAVDAPLPGLNTFGAVTRHWLLTETGDLTASSLSFTYLPADIPATANENDFRIFRNTGGTLTNFCNPSGTGCVTGPNTVTTTVTPITDFSPWGVGQLFSPTSASVDVGGRIREANGRGISRVRVTMTDAAGSTRMAFTNQFGYYQFTGVPVGGTYVFAAAHRRYQFSEPTQVRFINEATDSVHFTVSGENPGFRPGATFFDQAPLDFDGDGVTDVSVYRNSTNTWYIKRSSDNTLFAQAFGAAGDRLAPADFDGDGKTDLAVFRPSEGNWYVWLSASNSLRVETFGAGGDRAIPADFDGDRQADFSVWNEMRGTWQVKLSADGATVSQRFTNGKGDFAPIASDRDGDGKADFVFFNRTNATWTIRTSQGANVKEQFGQAGDRAAMGDFDGDGLGDLATYRAGEYVWTVRLADGKELTDLRLSAGADNPAIGDFDGDGVTDAAGFGSGVWSIRQSVNNAVRQQQFGSADDTVIPSIQ